MQKESQDNRDRSVCSPYGALYIKIRTAVQPCGSDNRIHIVFGNTCRQFFCDEIFRQDFNNFGISDAFVLFVEHLLRTCKFLPDDT